MPPAPEDEPEIKDKWKQAILENDGGTLLQLIVEEVSKNEEKHKSLASDYEKVQTIVNKMQSILNHEFLKIDFQSHKRDINNKQWDNLLACQKSVSGHVGIYFFQCGDIKDKLNSKKNEIIAAKAYTLQDYQRTLFVYELATHYFQIKSPKVRYISREDPEFTELQNAVKNLFEPLYGDLYEIGGSKSPKDLFESRGIMLLEFVHGRQLTHRKNGQRPLSAEDYYEIGKMFLFDLLIRNTDRFPCQKAFPRPMARFLQNIGNPGNIMFGHHSGHAWSIDPELQINVSDVLQDVYGRALQSVTKEILFRQDLDRRYQSIAFLFFRPVAGIEDVLPLPLNDIYSWELCNENEKSAIESILQLIRIKLAKDPSIILEQRDAERSTFPSGKRRSVKRKTAETNSPEDYNRTVLSPSGCFDESQSLRQINANSTNIDEESDNDENDINLVIPFDRNEKKWREWIRHIVPRVMDELFEFMELQTGYTTPYFARDSFCQGFAYSLQCACTFKKEYHHPSSPMHEYHKNVLEETANVESTIDISFVLDMISRIEKYSNPDKNYKWK
jgi:hypothetical protein